MADVELDVATFQRRAEKIFTAWDRPDEDTNELRDVSILQFLMGESKDAVISVKTAAIQTWLLGYEFPSTLILFHKTPRKVTFVGSPSKINILKQLETTKGIAIDLKTRGKDEASTKVMPDLVLSLGDSVKAGIISKDQLAVKGKFADEWNQAVNSSKGGVQTSDVSGAISSILADLDGDEVKAVLTAARLSSTAMNHYFKPKMESIIDRGTKVPHETLAAMIEEKLGNEEKEPDQKLWSKNPDLGKIEWSNVEWAQLPIVQSGGDYDLRYTAESNNKVLKPGVIISSIAIRYKSYCGVMGRTFLISPSKKQESDFRVLLDARAEALKHLKAGANVKEVYDRILNFVKSKDSALGDHFLKNIGWSMGMERRDNTFLLGPKNQKALKENQVLNLNLGLADLTDKKTTYSLLLSDTVKVGQEGSVSLTEGCTKMRDVVMELEGEDEPPKSSVPEKKKSNGMANGKSPAKTRAVATGGRSISTKTRGGQRDVVEQTTADKIKENQDRLHAQRQREGLEKWSKGDGTNRDGQHKQIKKYESYRREEQIPRQAEDRRIYVDEARQTVILPIYGFAVPYHISTIKNVTKTEESDYMVLRINFQSPGQIAGKKEDMPFEDPDATFVRSASFRSQDQRHMLSVFDKITNLKKTATKLEAERREMADVVEQGKLIEIKGSHPRILKNVVARPQADTKKTDGNLEIHQNGIRYRPDGPSQRIDILFSNMKHLFFQPSEKELQVLIHVNLKTPIMIGKKKTFDVQFAREVTDMAFDETGGKKRRARYGDEDEIEQEAEDKRRRAELDRLFKEFAKQIENAAQRQQYELEVDVPFRELGFNGVPFRSSVLLQPTTNCLVQLSEQPFTVVTLNEVEIVHLERVQFGLKNFDMVFILNDFKKAPIHINTIPMEHLDNVKEWLDSCDVPLSEGRVNLSWTQIMKTINDDPYGFYDSGGWSFVTGDGDDSEEDESEEGSEFEAESEAFDESSSDSESGSDFDDGGSDESGSYDEEDDEGEDWDELEAKAKRADDKRREKDGDDSDDGKKKKKSGRR